MDIFEKAKKQPSFNFWLEDLPEEDLRYLSGITDEVSAGELKDEDVFEQMIALVIHFSGKESMTEDELEDAFTLLTIDLGLELNIREGKMTKTGTYSLLRNEETSSFKMTDKGMESVRNMIKDRPTN